MITAYLLILSLLVINCIQGWIILYQLVRLKKQQDQTESELKQFRGVAKLKDLPNEQQANGAYRYGTA